MKGMSSCQNCPIGFFCATNDAPPVACNAEDEYSDAINQESCSTCPAGSDCSDHTATPVACGTDQEYNNHACLTCPAGNECSAGVASACSTGDTAEAGDATCTTPTSTQFAAAAEIAPDTCDSGTTNTFKFYSTDYGICEPCPAGEDCTGSSTCSGAQADIGDPNCQSETLYEITNTNTIDMSACASDEYDDSGTCT